MSFSVPVTVFQSMPPSIKSQPRCTRIINPWFEGLVGDLGIPHGKNFTESHWETLEGAIFI